MSFDEVKTTYLFLAKFCHPDTGTAGDHLQRTKWMQRANQANAEKDLPALNAILAEVIDFSSGFSNARTSSTSQPPPPPPGPTEQQRRQEQVRRMEEARRRAQADRARAKATADQTAANAAAQAKAASQAKAAARAKAQEDADRLTGDVEAKRYREAIQSQPTSAPTKQVDGIKPGLLTKKRAWGAAILCSGVFIGGITQLPSEQALTESSSTAAIAESKPTKVADLPSVQLNLNPASGASENSTGSSGGSDSRRKLVKITTSLGEGAYLRRTKSWDDKGQVLYEGQLLQIIRADIFVDGRNWYYVRVPESGVTGYLPSELVTVVQQ